MRSLKEIIASPMEALTPEEQIVRVYCTEGAELMSRPRESLTPDQRAACEYWALAETNPIPVPVLSGDYVHIYQPKGETYRSVDHPLFKSGTYCENWVSNDFSIIHDGSACI